MYWTIPILPCPLAYSTKPLIFIVKKNIDESISNNLLSLKTAIAQPILDQTHLTKNAERFLFHSGLPCKHDHTLLHAYLPTSNEDPNWIQYSWRPRATLRNFNQRRRYDMYARHWL